MSLKQKVFGSQSLLSMQLGIAELSSKDSEAVRIPPHDIDELASCSKIVRECKGKVSEPR